MTDVPPQSHGDRPAGQVGSVHRLPVPLGLSAEQQRLGRSRSLTHRVLARGRARRRVLPPLIAGSVALIGSSVIGSWLFGVAPPPATAAPPTPTRPTAPPVDKARLAQDVTALNSLRQALVADQSAIAGLAQTTGTTSSGAPATSSSPTAGATSAPAGTAQSASAPIPAVPTAPTLSAPAPLPSLPSLPTLPTLPPVTVPAATPPVHTTTGATVVVH
ncbi:MAG TPA: hypothetical protein VNC61_07080 [Acidimicrobiales bacterium]|nr:hypothetical protein [Acidimicrobiales bacterium]